MEKLTEFLDSLGLQISDQEKFLTTVRQLEAQPAFRIMLKSQGIDLRKTLEQVGL